MTEKNKLAAAAALESQNTEDNEESIAKAIEADYDRSKRKSVHWAWLIFFWLLAGAAYIGVLLVIWHYAVPEEYQWVSDDKISDILKILGGGLGTLMLKSIEKRI